MMMIEFYLCSVIVLVFEQFYICAYFLLYLLNTYGLINTLFTLCHCVTKRGSIFGCSWYFDRKCISKPVKYFCPRMAKGGVY